VRAAEPEPGAVVERLAVGDRCVGGRAEDLALAGCLGLLLEEL
jgi:hypothetical protein